MCVIASDSQMWHSQLLCLYKSWVKPYGKQKLLTKEILTSDFQKYFGFDQVGRVLYELADNSLLNLKPKCCLCFAK